MKTTLIAAVLAVSSLSALAMPTGGPSATATSPVIDALHNGDDRMIGNHFLFAGTRTRAQVRAELAESQAKDEYVWIDGGRMLRDKFVSTKTREQVRAELAAPRSEHQLALARLVGPAY